MVGYLAISGFTALALALAWNRLQVKSKKIIFLLIYAAVMIAEYLGMPVNSDKISISMELLSGFQDFDSTNYRYVLGDLGYFIRLIVR